MEPLTFDAKRNIFERRDTRTGEVMEAVNMELVKNLLALFEHISPMEWEMFSDNFYEEVVGGVWMDGAHLNVRGVEKELWHQMQTKHFPRLVTLGSALRQWRRHENALCKQLWDKPTAELNGVIYDMDAFNQLHEALEALDTLYWAYHGYVLPLWRKLLYIERMRYLTTLETTV